MDEDTAEVVTIERNEIILERDVIIDEDHIDMILEANESTIILQREDIGEDYSIIYNTLQKDPTSSEMEAVQYIYRQLRGSDPLMKKQPVVSSTNCSSLIRDTT